MASTTTGLPDQVAVAVRLEPVQRGARAPRPVHRRRADQDDLVGQAQHSGHGRVQQAGPAIGEADRVVVLQHLAHVAVVLLAERHRHGGVAIGGEHLQPARGLRGVGPDVRVPLDLVLLVQQVADGGGGLEPELVGQGAPVGVGVYRDDPVPAQRGQRGAQADGGRGLAHAALQAHYRDPVMPAGDRGPGPGDQFPAAPLRGGLARADHAAGHLEDCAAPAAGRSLVPPGQEQVSGEAVGRDRLRRCGCWLRSRRGREWRWCCGSGAGEPCPARNSAGPASDPPGSASQESASGGGGTPN